MRFKLLLAFLAAASAVTVTGAEPAQAASPDVGYKQQGYTCVPRAQGTFSVRYRARMIVTNPDESWKSTYVQGMKVRVRLVPLNSGVSGQNWSRKWEEQRADGLTMGERHVRDFTVLTDNVNPDIEWKLQIKLVWDRIAPRRDYVMEFKPTQAVTCNSRFGAGGGT